MFAASLFLHPLVRCSVGFNYDVCLGLSTTFQFTSTVKYVLHGMQILNHCFCYKTQSIMINEPLPNVAMCKPRHYIFPYFTYKMERFEHGQPPLTKKSSDLQNCKYFWIKTFPEKNIHLTPIQPRLWIHEFIHFIHFFIFEYMINSYMNGSDYFLYVC